MQLPHLTLHLRPSRIILKGERVRSFFSEGEVLQYSCIDMFHVFSLTFTPHLRFAGPDLRLGHVMRDTYNMKKNDETYGKYEGIRRKKWKI